PRNCAAHSSEGLSQYLHARKNNNWGTRNQESGIDMFACPADSYDPLQCFLQENNGSPQFPLLSSMRWAKNWSQDYTRQNLRVLTKLNFQTSFWMRSSADGRFVANGLYNKEEKYEEDHAEQTLEQQFHGVITDLQSSSL